MGSPVNSKITLNGAADDVGGGVRWLAQQMSAPKPIVICGPSGSGKSTLLKCLMDEYGDFFGFSISHTTRKPRPGEKPGKDYYFVDVPEMENGVAKGEFLEYTTFSGNMYGTSKKAVKRVQDQGRICILDIEIEGVKNIKKTDLKPRYIFIKPPSVKVLEERLRGRGTESEENVQKRLARAKEELRYGEAPGNFDLVLVNDNADETYKQLRSFLLPLLLTSARFLRLCCKFRSVFCKDLEKQKFYLIMKLTEKFQSSMCFKHVSLFLRK